MRGSVGAGEVGSRRALWVIIQVCMFAVNRTGHPWRLLNRGALKSDLCVKRVVAWTRVVMEGVRS